MCERVMRKNNNLSHRPLTISAQYGLIDQRSFFNKTVASPDLSNYTLIKEGEFAYNKSSSSEHPWGSVKCLTIYSEGALSPLYICFAPKHAVIQNWLVQYYESSKWHKEISEIATEGARNHGLLNVSVPDFFQTKLHIPSKAEQRKIAGFLSLLDERIAAQRALIGEMGRLIKGLNDTIYSRYCTEEETSFSKIGISYCGLQGKSAEDFGFGKPYISYLKVHNNRILDDSECELVNIRSGERQNLVRHGDVLFTLSSETPEEVGLGAVYLGTKEVYLNSFCFGIHFINPIVFPPYMAFFISTSYFRKFIFPFAQGSTRYNLQKADFEKATLHLPNLDHQKKIYAIMKSITHKLELEKRILQDYLLQKQYLLRQMFI